MLTAIWRFLFGSSKKEEVTGVFYVMDMKTSKILYDSTDYKDACAYATAQVERVDDRFVILTEIASTRFEVKVKDNKD